MAIPTTAPAPPGSQPPAGLFSRRHRSLTVGVATVMTLIAFEGMGVTTVMPVAARDLHGLPFYAWGFSAFLIANMVGTVLSGQWSDRRGPALPFYLGITTFTLGLVLAGSAPAMWMFVLARGIQGLGGGMFVALFVLIGRTYDPAVRPRVFALISSVWVVPALVGPALAGFIAEHVGWRWVFLALPPLVIPAVLLMFRSLQRYGGPGGGEAATRPGRLFPAAAVAAGTALLFSGGQRLSWSGVALVAGGLALLAAGLPRLLPAGALRLRPGLPATVVMRGLLTGAFFGTDAFIPLGLTEVRAFAPSQAGLALTGGAIGWAIASWYQGRPRMTMPRHRLIRAGTVLIALAIPLVGLSLWPRVSGWLAVPAWTLGGFGMGLGMASLNVLVLELSSRAEQGASTSAMQLCDMLGSALTIGLGGVIVAAANAIGASTGWGIWLSEACMVAVALFAFGIAPRLAVQDPAAVERQPRACAGR